MPQRRLVLLGILGATAAPFMLAAGGARAQADALPINPDDIETDEGDIVIQPINGASLMLSFDSDVILVDPVGGAARYGAFNRPTALLVTGTGPAHFDLPTLVALATGAMRLIAPEAVVEQLPPPLKAQARSMKNGDKGDLGGLPIEAVPAYGLSPAKAKLNPKGAGNGYVLTVGEAKVYIAGDTEDTPEMRALEGIGIAFLPMNPAETMSASQAASAVEQFKPVMVYPYNYGKGGAEPDRFAAALHGNVDTQVRERDWYAYG